MGEGMRTGTALAAVMALGVAGACLYTRYRADARPNPPRPLPQGVAAAAAAGCLPVAIPTEEWLDDEIIGEQAGLHAA